MSYHESLGLNEAEHAARIAARNAEDKARVARGEAPLYSHEAQRQERLVGVAPAEAGGGGPPILLIGGLAVGALVLVLLLKKKKAAP